MVPLRSALSVVAGASDWATVTAGMPPSRPRISAPAIESRTVRMASSPFGCAGRVRQWLGTTEAANVRESCLEASRYLNGASDGPGLSTSCGRTKGSGKPGA